MIIQESLAASAAAQDGPHAVRPRYEGYCFAQIPATVRALFGGGPGGVPIALPDAVDTALLLFVDAFGWRFFERYADHPFLRRFAEEGQAAKISAQFPSTTAAHVTAIHTGLTPGESGVHEWYYYEPRVGAVIAPLLFSRAGEPEREGLRGLADPRELFPTSTVYHGLAPLGVESFVLTRASYAGSSYNSAVTDGARSLPFATVREGLRELAALPRRGARRYAVCYIDVVDSACHLHGPDSPLFEAEVLQLLDTLERALHRALLKAEGRTLLMLTADHGQIAVDPATRVALDVALPELTPLLRADSGGRPLAPAGSSRDMFLYLRPGALEEAEGMLARALAGRAEVRRTADLMAAGFFGRATPALAERVGELVVLPAPGEQVWWSHEYGRPLKPFRGMHGGLTREEMDTPLLTLLYGG